MTKASEFRELSDAELQQRLDESKEELFNLRFQLVTGQLDNASRIGHIKRDIARFHTIIRQREIAAAQQSA
jgi:large subunit ribosomal protein L29